MDFLKLIEQINPRPPIIREGEDWRDSLKIACLKCGKIVNNKRKQCDCGNIFIENDGEAIVYGCKEPAKENVMEEFNKIGAQDSVPKAGSQG